MALNPVIKFTTLFGLLAVELAVSLVDDGLHTLVLVLAAVFFAVSMYFVHRSFYGMRITSSIADDDAGLGEPEPGLGGGAAAGPAAAAGRTSVQTDASRAQQSAGDVTDTLIEQGAGEAR